MSGGPEPVRTAYAADGSARYVVYRRRAGLFAVWLQRRETDPVYHPGEVWYTDIRDSAHFAASLDEAARIGEEGLRNLAAVLY